MPHTKLTFPLLLLFLSLGQRLGAQAAPGSAKPPDAKSPDAKSPDVLVLTDGEKLIGHLQSSSGSSVVFKSDIVGNVTVDWSKVQELQSSQVFAAIPKGVKLRGSQDASKAPQGTVTASNQTLQLSPS